MKENWKKILVFLLAVFVIVANGKLVYTNSYRFKLDNKYCVPQATFDMAYYVTRDFDSPLIIAPLEILMYIRQYDSNIQVPFSRFFFSDLKLQDQDLYDALSNQEEYDIEVIAGAAKEHKAMYVVLNALIPQKGDIEKEGFEFQTWLDGYNIYRYKQLYNDYVEYGVIKK